MDAADAVLANNARRTRTAAQLYAGIERSSQVNASFGRRAGDGVQRKVADALAQQRIDARFQPSVRGDGGRFVGFEALSRWTRAGEPASPGVFILVAETAGPIRRLDRYTVERVVVSLAHLRTLPVDVVKVDHRSVNGIGRQESGETLIRAVVEYVRSLRLQVIAEAVETDDQHAWPRGQQVELDQGCLRGWPGAMAVDAVANEVPSRSRLDHPAQPQSTMPT